jgi:hypothetical protein
MIMLLSFIAALVTVLLGGGIAYYIAKHFASNRAARIGAFWLLVGATVGRYFYFGPLIREAAPAFSALAGAALAILLLWRLLLKPLGNDISSDRL